MKISVKDGMVTSQKPTTSRTERNEQEEKKIRNGPEGPTATSNPERENKGCVVEKGGNYTEIIQN